MYLQITTRCNMSCLHCGMNCTTNGEDMSFDTFKAAIAHKDYVCLGGGEPTIHPDFGNFLMYAIGHCNHVFPLTVITNGSMTNISLALAKLNSDSFNAQLSLDDYHDSIDQSVIDAFKKAGEIRNTTKNTDPIKAGRCDWGKEGCICEGESFVKPNGDVHQCGCDDSPKVGTVFDDELHPINSIEDYGEWICHKNIKKDS